MTGNIFRAIRTRHGVTALELVTFVQDKYNYTRTTNYIYQIENDEVNEVPERWVGYLEAFCGKEIFKRLKLEAEGGNDE
jgi:transcriptional regulator with XRE-family HTH domain